ncbi:IST1 [Tripterygium wilfordii]|uniref:IST1 n=1 Tax=Tripterygium wilfordii TaxID=458696 RepID=A0A7J7BUP8_TRIWF|nr:uncharacterized protein LOC119993295 [Tripterygium wilfordii]KAF5725613.1 IST1 [Tripterygium wilfordii]
MSMLDSFFNKGFKAAKCKTLLKLTIPRIKLLRNRREIQIKQMRRDIAKLLETGQEATARIRVEHIIREEKMIAAQEIMELFCELIAVRLPIIEVQKECPLDLKEAISSVCFAAPRCADLPELLQVQMLFASKYGKEFVSAATELMPDCGVNRQLIELLSVRAPSPETKLKLLKEIAEEHQLDWDPASSETEFFKPHEDLLNGPTQFVGGSKLPLPTEKHDETLNSDEAHTEQPDSDSDSELLDFPEVPKVSLQPSTNVASAPEKASVTSAVPFRETDHESLHYSEHENLAPEGHLKNEEWTKEELGISKYEMPSVAVDAKADKQFLPFVSPPTLSSASFSAQRNIPPPTLSSASISAQQNIPPPTLSSASISAQQNIPPPTLSSASFSAQQNIPPPTLSSASFSARQNISPLSLSKTKSEANVDLQDVLAAAQAAAESAELAAAAARSAASLAQVRISELIKKNGNANESSNENPFHANTPDPLAIREDPQFNHQNSLENPDGTLNSPDSYHVHEDYKVSEMPNISSFDQMKMSDDIPVFDDRAPEVDEHTRHQPQRLPSMDDDPYSYPNLFSSNLGPDTHTSMDNSRSTHQL